MEHVETITEDYYSNHLEVSLWRDPADPEVLMREFILDLSDGSRVCAGEYGMDVNEFERDDGYHVELSPRLLRKVESMADDLLEKHLD